MSASNGADYGLEASSIAVVGLGYIGSVIAAVLADEGARVYGIDISKARVDAINSGAAPVREPGLDELVARTVARGGLSATTSYEPVSRCRTVLITVGTPLGDNNEPDVFQLEAATEALAPHVQGGQLIIVKSTVPPFSTERVVASRLRQGARVKVAFSPERLAEGQAIREFKSIPIVVGGVDEESTIAAAGFWRSVLTVPVIEVSSSTAAELVKLADNMWIDLNIALAFELAKLSDAIGTDVLEVISAANSLPKGTGNVNILMPSLGVGGYCLTKDPWFLRSFGLRHGVNLNTPVVSRTVNDGAPEYSAAIIDKVLSDGANGRKKSDTKIAVLGLAFKNDTGDCRYTPTAPAINALVKMGYDVVVHDPWVTPEEARRTTNQTIADDIEAAVRDADCIAFFTGHHQFRGYPLERVAELAKPNALVFDGRMFFTKERRAVIERLGMRFKGVGR